MSEFICKHKFQQHVHEFRRAIVYLDCCVKCGVLKVESYPVSEELAVTRSEDVQALNQRLEGGGNYG